MDFHLKKYVEKTNAVFKLKIALCNCDLKIARRDNDLILIKRLHGKQLQLVDEFKEWKKLIKKRYTNATGDQNLIQDIQRKIKHAEAEATRLCDLIEQHESNQIKTNRHSDVFSDRSFNASRRSSFGKPNTNDRYPLKQEEYETRMSIPLEEHLKFARSFSAEITSEIKTDCTAYHDGDLLFAISWEDFTSYFLNENRKQHEADRLIENTISKFVSYYWKQIEPVTKTGLMPSSEVRSKRLKLVAWIKERLASLEKIEFKAYPFPKKLEENMHNYLRLVNDAVIDTTSHLMRCMLFDALRGAKLTEFCTQPTVELFKRLVMDEVSKNYGFFNTRQVGASAQNQNHLERLKNEATVPANKWMMTRVRLQHEIARLNQVN